MGYTNDDEDFHSGEFNTDEDDNPIFNMNVDKNLYEQVDEEE